MADRKRKKVAKKKATKKKVTRKKKKARPQVIDRATQMQDRREQGYTFEAIAEEFGVSRQRVHQLVSGAEGATPPKKKSSNNEPATDLLRGRGIEEKKRQYKAAAKNAVKATVGDRIVFCRLKRGMTIGQLSQESDVPYGVLSTYENNKAQPSCESLRKLCVALRVSAHWILFGQGFKRAEA
jgi:transcriptional regulator with XRE-family HTH domain